jgi:hypothetical protein
MVSQPFRVGSGNRGDGRIWRHTAACDRTHEGNQIRWSGGVPGNLRRPGGIRTCAHGSGEGLLCMPLVCENVLAGARSGRVSGAAVRLRRTPPGWPNASPPGAQSVQFHRAHLGRRNALRRAWAVYGKAIRTHRRPAHRPAALRAGRVTRAGSGWRWGRPVMLGRRRARRQRRPGLAGGGGVRRLRPAGAGH